MSAATAAAPTALQKVVKDGCWTAESFAPNVQAISAAVPAVINAVKSVVHKTQSSLPSGTLPASGYSFVEGKMVYQRSVYRTAEGARTACIKRMTLLKADTQDKHVLSLIDGIIEAMNNPDAEPQEDSGAVLLRYGQPPRSALKGLGRRPSIAITYPYTAKGGGCMAFHCFVTATTLANGQERFLFAWGLSSIAVVKATDYMIAVHSKENLWRSKTWHELVPLPSDNHGLTDIDCQQLAGLMVPFGAYRFHELAGISPPATPATAASAAITSGKSK